MNKDEYFAEIYELYYKKIYEFFVYKVYNVDLAEDLTNDVFVAVYKNLHNYDEEKSFILTWLYTISWNRLKNYYKSRRKIEYSIDHMVEMNQEPVVLGNDLLEQSEWYIVLQKLILDLVNFLDEEIGQGSKMDVHKKGLLHRAFSVFLYDGNKIWVNHFFCGVMTRFTPTIF